MLGGLTIVTIVIGVLLIPAAVAGDPPQESGE